MCRRCPQVLNWKNLEVMKDQWLHAALKVKWHRDLGQFQEISRKKFAQRGHGNRRAKIWRILAKKSGDFRKKTEHMTFNKVWLKVKYLKDMFLLEKMLKKGQRWSKSGWFIWLLREVPVCMKKFHVKSFTTVRLKKCYDDKESFNGLQKKYVTVCEKFHVKSIITIRTFQNWQ